MNEGCSLKPIICVVDDDVSALKSLSRMLAGDGYVVMPFTDPVEFIKHAAGNTVALAVVDCHLPLFNGLQIQACLRNLSQGTRVILVSDFDSPEQRKQAMDNGVCSLLLNPISESELLAAVREALAKGRE